MRASSPIALLPCGCSLFLRLGAHTIRNQQPFLTANCSALWGSDVFSLFICFLTRAKDCHNVLLVSRVWGLVEASSPLPRRPPHTATEPGHLPHPRPSSSFGIIVGPLLGDGDTCWVPSLVFTGPPSDF